MPYIRRTAPLRSIHSPRPRLAASPVAVGLLLAATTGLARAAAPEPASPAEPALRGHYRGDTVVLPGTLDKLGERGPKAIKHGVLYVNFDGVTVTMGGDHSPSDTSSIFGEQFAPYGGTDAEKTAILDALKIDFGAYDIEIVDERPAAGDYTMAVMSPTNPIGGSVLGIAPLDCYDGMPNNIVFAFHGSGDGYSPSGAAATISHEAGHSYGLEHVDDPSDIMNPANSGGDPTFRDQCTALVDPMVVCGANHEQFCPAGGTQNAHQELLEIFGPSTPDVSAPVVTITSPSHNAYYETGASFRIDVTATDDDEVRTLQLYDGDTPLLTTTMPPYGWDVFDVAEGVFEFTVTATDRVGNIGTSEPVTVYIGVEPPEEIGTTGDDAGQDGDGGGCGCTQSRPTHTGLGALLLALLGGARRRRTR